MNNVFLDTVGMLALWSEADEWHSAARKAHESLKQRNVVFLTTSYVLLECGNAAARRGFRGAVVRLRQELSKSETLIEPTPGDCQVAWSTFENSHIGSAGIVDCVSFVVMQRLGITEAFTNDEHFRAAGFTTLF